MIINKVFDYRITMAGMVESGKFTAICDYESQDYIVKMTSPNPILSQMIHDTNGMLEEFIEFHAIEDCPPIMTFICDVDGNLDIIFQDEYKLENMSFSIIAKFDFAESD